MIRVSRRQTCPICTKTGWCYFFDDRSGVVCMRIASQHPANGGGHIHWLRDRNDWTPPRRVVHRSSPRPSIDADAIHQRCLTAMSPEALGWLSNDLGISTDAIERYEIGYHTDRNVYSMPMRRPNGSICGIKYRRHDGRKFCESGSKSGVFFVPGSLVRDYIIIVEGCSDAMAIHDIGYQSVIGRDSCTANVQQITTLCRRLRPHRIVIIPDNDHHGRGQAGAVALRDVLAITHDVAIVELPEGINDVRDCISAQKNADRLADRIRESISSPQSSEGIDQ